VEKAVPRVGVAIVHYRAEQLLARSLEALFGSSFADFSVVVVDHGSETGLAWLEGVDGRARVLRPADNRGFAAGTNLALAALPEGIEYLLLLNPDVIVEPETLRHLVEMIDRDPTLGAATCRLRLPDGRIDPACRRSDPSLVTALSRFLRLARFFPNSRAVGGYNLTYLDATKSHDIEAGTAALLLVRADLMRRLGGMDERFFLYGEDLDLCRRVRGAEFRLRYSAEAEALHVKGSGRDRSMRENWEFHRSMWLYYRKWGSGRDNPFVLGPLALAIGGLATASYLRLAWRRVLGAVSR
jgi:GT2 family glycosyltransferase